LTVTVTDDDGRVVYRTWQAEEAWASVTLMLGQTGPDIDGNEIGLSYWDLVPRTPREISELPTSEQSPGGGRSGA
jgi:hypothetical protein